MEDGGYYAIKGFSFQFIKSLYEIFNSKDKQKLFSLENEQDFNMDENVYQIKYKETQNYTPSKIKDAVIKILEEYKINKKNYILFAYFKNKNDEQIKFNSVKELNEILLNCKIDKKQYYFEDSLKEDFIKQFTIFFSKKYEEEVDKLIEIIAKKTSSNMDVAKIYYFQIVQYIIDLICNNVKNNRKVSLSELLLFLKENSNTIFYDYFHKYQNKEKYIKFLKKEYFSERILNKHERLFLIDFKKLYDIDLIIDAIISIKKRFYKTNSKKTFTVSPAPYIFINNINEDTLKDIKLKLYSNGINFNDGYPYHYAEFNVDYIIKDNALKTENVIKIIEEKKHLESIIKNIESIKKIYRFYDESDFNLNFKYNNVKLEVINDIEKLLN